VNEAVICMVASIVSDAGCGHRLKDTIPWPSVSGYRSREYPEIVAYSARGRWLCSINLLPDKLNIVPGPSIRGATISYADPNFADTLRRFISKCQMLTSKKPL